MATCFCFVSLLDTSTRRKRRTRRRYQKVAWWSWTILRILAMAKMSVSQSQSEKLSHRTNFNGDNTFTEIFALTVTVTGTVTDSDISTGTVTFIIKLIYITRRKPCECIDFHQFSEWLPLDKVRFLGISWEPDKFLGIQSPTAPNGKYNLFKDIKNKKESVCSERILNTDWSAYKKTNKSRYKQV